MMLERGVLPLQKCKKALWEFSPADPKTVLSLLHHSWEKMWKNLFLTEEVALLSEWMARMNDLHLYDMVQIMLERRVLPLQERKKALWEFSPADPKMVLSLLHHLREKMWKSLFLTEEDRPGHIRPFPEEGIDHGLSEEADSDQVRTPYPVFLQVFDFSLPDSSDLF